MDDTEAFITRCAWCTRCHVGERWQALEALPAGRSITHGICPDCFARVTEGPVPARLLLALEEGP